MIVHCPANSVNQGPATGYLRSPILKCAMLSTVRDLWKPLRVPIVSLVADVLAPGIQRLAHGHAVFQLLVIVAEVVREADQDCIYPGTLRREIVTIRVRAPD